MNETYLYPYSAQEARTRNQLPMWRESYHANVACRNAIEETIRQNFDGMHLKKDCLEPVLAEYGYKRTEWVLATTLQELSWDGRFSRANKQWAARRYIPQDERHNAEITVRSHPAILDGFVDLYRKAYQELGLFGPEHCVGDRAEQDYIGKVLVLSPDTLKESCWSQENQLWYSTATSVPAIWSRSIPSAGTLRLPAIRATEWRCRMWWSCTTIPAANFTTATG